MTSGECVGTNAFFVALVPSRGEADGDDVRTRGGVERDENAYPVTLAPTASMKAARPSPQRRRRRRRASRIRASPPGDVPSICGRSSKVTNFTLDGSSYRTKI